MAIDSLGSIQDNYTKYADLFDSKSKDTMSMDTFYQLLIAEMSNQDPMEPMSNTEFVSQMASFTSLQTQQDALYYNNANYAQSLVGKSVTVASESGNGLMSDSGIVTSMSLQNGEFQVKVNGNYYALSNIMEVLPSSNPYAVNGSDASYGAALIGKQVTVEATNDNGQTIYETGTVSHIEIKDTEVSVIVDGISYPITSVLKVENAPVGSSAEDGEAQGAAKSANPADISYASSLIGKIVTVNVEDYGYSIYGPVSSIEVSNGEVHLVINDEEYSLSAITKVENPVVKEPAASTNTETKDEVETEIIDPPNENEVIDTPNETNIIDTPNGGDTVDTPTVPDSTTPDIEGAEQNQQDDSDNSETGTDSSNVVETQPIDDDTQELNELFG